MVYPGTINAESKAYIFVADLVGRNFQKMFRKSGEAGSKLFVQDNCPILKCAKARKALKDVSGKLFPIPKRSVDLNPVENIFHVYLGANPPTKCFIRGAWCAWVKINMADDLFDRNPSQEINSFLHRNMHDYLKLKVWLRCTPSPDFIMK